MELTLCPVPVRGKRPIGATAILYSSLIGLAISGATRVGTSVLILQDYQALQLAINSDLKNIEQFILKFETSLDSLDEIASQNQRGLDLLFMCCLRGRMLFLSQSLWGN